MTGLVKVFSRAGRTVTRTLCKSKPIAKAVAKISRNKPEIMGVAGGVCIVVAFGWAIYEATTVKDTMEETAERVKQVEDDFTQNSTEDKTEEENKALMKKYKHDLTVARVDGVWKVGKKFVVPVILLGTGLTMGKHGFKLLRTQNIVLAGALKGRESFIKFYRDNVRKELGDEADLKYARGIVGEKEVEETKKDGAGNDIKVKTKVPVVHNETNNPWRFEFSEDWFDSWQDNTDLNLFFLKCEQDWWQHEYERNSRVTIYEILKHMRFKFENMRAGMTKKQFVDWLYFIRNYGWWKGSKGDGFVDFGIYRAINEAAIMRRSDVIFVEFNCDGNLADEWQD